jgi:hypothetical protein
VRGGSSGAERAGLDQVQGKNSVWALVSPLPARCLLKWPKENKFRNLQIFLVGCKHISKGVEWWWFGSIWSCFAKSQNAYDLTYVSKS